jgi:ATP-dependent helicase/nuclease subunit B
LGAQPPAVFTDLLKAELTLGNLQTGQPHPRLAIWGPLEARLQTADRIILAGLNEGIWPAQPPADAFLPRVFRKEIGLSDPDERVGLSAHDFAQLAAAPNVFLLTSARRDDKPVVASRWIWRLRTLARGALGKASAKIALAATNNHDPLVWIKAMEDAPKLQVGFRAEPRPTPPRDARPDALSVTRIETLVRDPYAIYCQYVLGLQSLDALNLPGDVRNRGTAIHSALELLEDDGQDKSVDGLVNLLERELRAGGETEAELIALREKRREVATEYIAWRAEHAARIDGRLVLEKKGSTTLTIKGEPFKLSGTADRIEPRIGGRLAILDFKSGKPPSEAQVRAGLSPQMPLQGLIAQRGGFAKYTNATEVEALTYIRFGTQFDVRELGEEAGRGASKLEAIEIGELIAEAEAGLVKLLTQFANPDHPYLSAPRPERVTYWSDYTRLARRDEWTGLTTYD